jgi:hypothetical protein
MSKEEKGTNRGTAAAPGSRRSAGSAAVLDSKEEGELSDGGNPVAQQEPPGSSLS